MTCIVCISIGIVVCTILFFLRKKPLGKDQFGCWIGEKKEGETRVRRDLLSKDKLIDAPKQGYKTLYELIESFPSLNQKTLSKQVKTGKKYSQYMYLTKDLIRMF